jgi:serine/threonine protein kinase
MFFYFLKHVFYQIQNLVLKIYDKCSSSRGGVELISENKQSIVYRYKGSIYKFLKTIVHPGDELNINELRINEMIRNSGKNISELDRLLFYEKWWRKKNSGVIIKMENGIIDLFSFVDKKTFLSDDKLIYIAREMIIGILQLHSLGIVHFDVSLENFILMKNGKIKLCDFGLSYLVGELSGCYLTAPKQNYSPPELNESEPIENPLKIDVYAFGMCLFYLLTGVEYTVENRQYHMNYGIDKFVRDLKCDESFFISKKLSFIIDNCMSSDPGKRLYPHQILKFIDDTSIIESL